MLHPAHIPAGLGALLYSAGGAHVVFATNTPCKGMDLQAEAPSSSQHEQPTHATRKQCHVQPSECAGLTLFILAPFSPKTSPWTVVHTQLRLHCCCSKLWGKQNNSAQMHARPKVMFDRSHWLSKPCA